MRRERTTEKWIGIDARTNEKVAEFNGFRDADAWANQVEYPVKIMPEPDYARLVKGVHDESISAW